MHRDEFKHKCTNCGRDIMIIITSGFVPGGIMKEDVFCPYCHQQVGSFSTDGKAWAEKIEPQPTDINN